MCFTFGRVCTGLVLFCPDLNIMGTRRATRKIRWWNKTSTSGLRTNKFSFGPDAALPAKISPPTLNLLLGSRSLRASFPQTSSFLSHGKEGTSPSRLKRLRLSGGGKKKGRNSEKSHCLFQSVISFHLCSMGSEILRVPTRVLAEYNRLKHNLDSVTSGPSQTADICDLS